MPKSDQDTTKVLSKNIFPVVGIGASAGGLEAFKKLIKAILFRYRKCFLDCCKTTFFGLLQELRLNV